MKTCPHCNAQVADNATFCTSCGQAIAPQQPQPYQQQYQQPIDQYDHTAEFSPAEVSDNKTFAVSVYLLGFIGIIIALLATGGKSSNYLRFHIKQELKLILTQVLVTFFAIIPCVGWVATGICTLIIVIVQIICFFKACSGKSVEAPIVRSLSFLK